MPDIEMFSVIRPPPPSSEIQYDTLVFQMEAAQ